ncbi:MAG: hypothetical protein RJB14_3130 [Pseudomonadota bacterium]|jgi:hypothetical protein
MTAYAMSSDVQPHDTWAEVYPDANNSGDRPALEIKDARVLKQVKSLCLQRKLLNANQHSQIFIGLQSEETDDPSGSVLRKLRIQQGLDPAVVATHACISVWQLYELETGKSTLFYTPVLRTRAAERVARFLQSDWTEICQGRVTAKSQTQVQQAATAPLQLIASHRHEPRSIRVRRSPEPVATPKLSQGPLSLAQLLRVADTPGRRASA